MQIDCINLQFICSNKKTITMNTLLFVLITLIFIATVILFLAKLNNVSVNNNETYLPSGYHKLFKRWSELYRKFRNYTCEECNIRLAGKDKYYLHTHHIDGNKANNHPNNFKALCISCHAEQPGQGHQRLKNTPAYREYITQIRPDHQINTYQNPLLKQSIY